MSAIRKLQLVLLLALFGLAGGMLGFMFLEDMDPLTALYMTVITLSTVGFGEIKPLHEGGRVFVILLIAFGVFLAGSTVTYVSELVIEGHFKHLVARRKMESNLKQRYGVSIVGIKQAGRKMDINPASTTTLQTGDVLVVIGRTEDVERFGSDLRS